MLVLKNIGPLKIRGSVVCRFMIGKPVPDVALKHWSDEDIKSLVKSGAIGDKNQNEPVRQNKIGQQTDTKQGILGSDNNNQ